MPAPHAKIAKLCGLLLGDGAFARGTHGPVCHHFTVQLRDRPGDPVACGPTGIEPDVVLAMPAVVLHRLLLGTVNATVAMARGQIRTEGPVAKVLALIPTLRLVGPAYRERLEAAGRTDLLESG